MPKRSRKSKVKRIRYKTQSGLKPTVEKEVSQRSQPLPVASKHIPVAKSQMDSLSTQEGRIRHVPQELKRIAMIAVPLLVLLIIVSLLLR